MVQSNWLAKPKSAGAVQFYRAGFVFYRVNGLGNGEQWAYGRVAPLIFSGGRIMEWPEFLVFASGPGVNVIVGTLLSEVVAIYLPGFAALASRWKRVAFFLLCLIVPLLASVLGVATAGWPATWVATYWPALVAGAVAFGSGTLAHTRKMTGKAELRSRLAVAHARIEALEGRV